MTSLYYNWVMKKQRVPRRDLKNPRKVSNFTRRVRGIHVFIGNFTYIMDFLVVEDAGSAIDNYLSYVVLDGIDKVAYLMPQKVEQHRLMPNLKKDFMQAVYVRSEDDNKKEVGYVMKKMFVFYKECLELGSEYKVNQDDIGRSVTDDGVT
ncbi:hypothetical protein Tco_1518132 [Tanacetum coccineum]